MEWLSRDAQERLADACRALLQKRLKPAIERDVELLSDSGRDRMFNSASSVFLRLPKILAARLEDSEQLAFRMVRSVADSRHPAGSMRDACLHVAQQHMSRICSLRLIASQPECHLWLIDKIRQYLDLTAEGNPILCCLGTMTRAL